MLLGVIFECSLLEISYCSVSVCSRAGWRGLSPALTAAAVCDDSDPLQGLHTSIAGQAAAPATARASSAPAQPTILLEG